MQYEKDILLLLIEAGEKGLSVTKITRHIFNTYNSFFLSLNIEDTHQEVQQCLLKMSKRPNSMLGRVRKGVYCININNQEVRHLQLKFSHECDIKKDEKTQTDFSLNLFE